MAPPSKLGGSSLKPQGTLLKTSSEKTLKPKNDSDDIGKYDGSLESDAHEHVSPQDAPDLVLDFSMLFVAFCLLKFKNLISVPQPKPDSNLVLAFIRYRATFGQREIWAEFILSAQNCLDIFLP